jgi:outer membrane protein OmpA-like peptidoglycan-associated protein
MLTFKRSCWSLALSLSLLLGGGVARADDDDDRRSSVHEDQDEDECELLNQMKAPTVYGGTGLFNTYSTRTLDYGEYSVGFFWNNFDRDPGDMDVNQITANVTAGFAERWEVWVNWNVWQQTTIRNPFLVSGYQYNALNSVGLAPFAFLGPPFGGTNGTTAFFPGTGAPGGGILPVLGRFGSDGIPDVFGQQGGAVGLGPALLVDRPSYYPDLPFVGQVDFFGFDVFGRPVFSPRQSGNGVGDVQVGTKVEVIDPDDNWFSMAAGFTINIPTARNHHALARGRTSGQVDYGPFVAFGQEWADGSWRLYENVSYTVTSDVHVGDVKVLDRPHKLGLGVGLSVAPSEHLEILGEVNSTHWITGHTPNFDERDPVDLTIGARWFWLDGQLSLGGAYRRYLNGRDAVTLPTSQFQGIVTPGQPIFTTVNTTFDNRDRNGFVAYFGFGGRGECETEPENKGPVCSGVSADKTEVFSGDAVGLMANASDPDGDVLVYTWTATSGRVIGSGSNVTFDTTGLVDGNYTITATVDDGFRHIVDCSVTIMVKPRPNECPSVTLKADQVSVTQGETVTFTATASDPDNGPRSLTYRWTSTSGSLQGTGSTARLDTSSLQGSVTVSVTVSDGDPKCQDTESVTINIAEARSEPQRPLKLTDLYFPQNNARINNEHKAVLDDAALRLRSDPRMVLVIDGHSATGERRNIARLRAENARDYLVKDAGIDPNRIIVRSFDEKCSKGDANADRRVELYLLPEGVTVDQIRKDCSGAE